MPGAAAEPRTGRTGGARAGRPAHRRAQPQEPDEAGARRHSAAGDPRAQEARLRRADRRLAEARPARSEEHTSELQSLMRISYAVFCLKKKKSQTPHIQSTQTKHMHE